MPNRRRINGRPWEYVTARAPPDSSPRDGLWVTFPHCSNRVFMWHSSTLRASILTACHLLPLITVHTVHMWYTNILCRLMFLIPRGNTLDFSASVQYRSTPSTALYLEHRLPQRWDACAGTMDGKEVHPWYAWVYGQWADTLRLRPVGRGPVL